MVLEAAVLPGSMLKVETLPERIVQHGARLLRGAWMAP
jgi:hypothetical protein